MLPVPTAMHCRAIHSVNRIASHGARSVRTFHRAQRGAVAIETVIAITVLVIAFAALIEIVRSAYVSDSMDRAARAAARAIALTPQVGTRNVETVACAAIRRELGLAERFDCGARWTLTVDTGLTPSALQDRSSPGESEAAGNMVLVRIAWNRELWELGRLVPGENGDDGEQRQLAVGVAHGESGTGG